MAENGFSRFLAVSLWFFLSPLTLFSMALGATAPDSGVLNERRVPGEILVMYRHEALGMAKLSNTIPGLVSARTLIGTPRIQLVRVENDSKILGAMQALARLPEVQFVEPNAIYSVHEAGAPDDEHFNALWGMSNTGQKEIDRFGNEGQEGTPGSDINILPVWQKGITGSRAIRVAVIDTGIEWTHPDLVDNLWTNPGEAGDLATNGIDDDGNGYIDDVHGFNFVTDKPNSQDDHGHGSHCAGTIGGTGNNGRGVVGVNWEVTLVPVKTFSKDGFAAAANLVEGVTYATRLGVNIMSNSWGGSLYSDIMKATIESARDKGILFVAAAGNNKWNVDSQPFYPAAYPVENVVAVAAFDNRDQLAKFSNYGAKSVHVAAPGVSILSSVIDGKYKYMSGTSMATPHVAGLAALMLSHDSSLSYAQIKERMIRTSSPVSTLRKKVIANGRVNAWNALMDITPESPEPLEGEWKIEETVVETAHPYLSRQNKEFRFTRLGATRIRAHFTRISVEGTFDLVDIENANGDRIERFSGDLRDVTTDYVEGDTLVVRLRSDTKNEGWGFLIDRIQFTE